MAFKWVFLSHLVALFLFLSFHCFKGSVIESESYDLNDLEEYPSEEFNEIISTMFVDLDQGIRLPPLAENVSLHRHFQYFHSVIDNKRLDKSDFAFKYLEYLMFRCLLENRTDSLN